MEKFYKISKEDAILISRFEYDKSKAIDPFVNEQKDGTYLVSEQMHELLKDHPNLKKIDFSKKELISADEVDTKPDDEKPVEDVKIADDLNK